MVLMSVMPIEGRYRLGVYRNTYSYW